VGIKERVISNNPHFPFLCPLNQTGAYPSCYWAGGRVHPEWVTSPSQGPTETNNLIYLGQFSESPVNQTCMFLDGGRKPEPEHPERTHAYTARTCKLHTERPQLGFKPGTFLL